jgi:hypothetical protein
MSSVSVKFCGQHRIGMIALIWPTRKGERQNSLPGDVLLDDFARRAVFDVEVLRRVVRIKTPVR